MHTLVNNCIKILTIIIATSQFGYCLKAEVDPKIFTEVIQKINETYSVHLFGRERIKNKAVWVDAHGYHQEAIRLVSLFQQLKWKQVPILDGLSGSGFAAIITFNSSKNGEEITIRHLNNYLEIKLGGNEKYCFEALGESPAEVISMELEASLRGQNSWHASIAEKKSDLKKQQR